MPKGNLSGQFFENFKSLGKSTVKSTAEALGSFSPLKIAQEMITPQTGNIENSNASTPEGVKKQNATPLNINKLSETYHKRDEQEAVKIQQRLFQMVNNDSNSAIGERQRMEQSREQQFRKDHEEKARFNAQPEEVEAITSKTARGARHAPQKKHTEIKPSTGKH
ncbi:MAG: hypothetical protein RI947_195 [Candidatus Parcubacteria bacterium]|jgi:hypothetical protein